MAVRGARRAQALLLAALLLLVVFDSTSAAARSGGKGRNKGRRNKNKKPALVILGDSLSDNGNHFRVTGGVEPKTANGYWQGRYSNGPVWNDYLALTTNLTIVNMAYGGATACPLEGGVSPMAPGQAAPPSLADLAGYLKASLHTISPNRAVVVWVGHNDFTGIMMAARAGNHSEALKLARAIPGCIYNVTQQLLAERITKQLVVATVAPLQLSPFINVVTSTMTPEDAAKVRQALADTLEAVNNGIKDVTEQLAQKYRGKAIVAVSDVFNDMSSVVANAESFGFTNATSACVQTKPLLLSWTPKAELTSTCQEPSKYVFWDGVHPTTASHDRMADYVRSLLALSTDLAL